MQLFFEGLLNKKVDFEVIARGNGVGVESKGRIEKAYPQEEESGYPGNSENEKLDNKMSPKYAQLRLSEVYINLGREIVLEVNSYTDPVVSNLSLTPEQKELLAKNGWSKNELLSALRTESILKKLKEEVNVLAGQYLSRTDAKIVIDRFNKEIQKTKISIGKSSMKGNL